MTAIRKFTDAETELTYRVHDMMVLPIARTFTPTPGDAETIDGLCHDGVLRRVTTVFGIALILNPAQDHGPWDPCVITEQADLDHAAALTVLRLRLEKLDFTVHRYGWRTRPLSTDPDDRPGIPETLYMDAPAALLGTQASTGLRQSLPDALACLCLAAPPDLLPVRVRKVFRDHRARHPHSAGPVILGALDPDRYRTLAHTLSAQHWTRHTPGRLSGGLPVPLPPLLVVGLNPKTK